jgi:hypothetical protein
MTADVGHDQDGEVERGEEVEAGDAAVGDNDPWCMGAVLISARKSE